MSDTGAVEADDFSKPFELVIRQPRGEPKQWGISGGFVFEGDTAVFALDHLRAIEGRASGLYWKTHSIRLKGGGRQVDIIWKTSNGLLKPFLRFERELLLRSAAVRPEAYARMQPGASTALVLLVLGLCFGGVAVMAGEDTTGLAWTTMLIGLVCSISGVASLVRGKTVPLRTVEERIRRHERRWGGRWTSMLRMTPIWVLSLLLSTAYVLVVGAA